MKKIKEGKGITLVALIITIIVLLILAVVTISAVNEGDLFAHANNAATSYEKVQKEENTSISNYLSEMQKHDANQTSTADQSEIVGTYYAADGDEVYTVVINNDGTLNFAGQNNLEYKYENNILSCNIYGTDLVWQYQILENETKVLYLEKSYGTPVLYATNTSGLNTSKIEGKYVSGHNYYKFVNDTYAMNGKIEDENGDANEDKLEYKYFTQYDLVYVKSINEASEWFKLDENKLIYLKENGGTEIYTKQD